MVWHNMVIAWCVARQSGNEWGDWQSEPDPITYQEFQVAVMGIVVLPSIFLCLC